MVDDFEIVDAFGIGILSDGNEPEIHCSGHGGQNPTEPCGFEFFETPSPFTWTHSPLLSDSNRCGVLESQGSQYMYFNGAGPTVFDTYSDTIRKNRASTRDDSTASKAFEDPIVSTDEVCQQDAMRASNLSKTSMALAKPYKPLPPFSIYQDGYCAAIKKRKNLISSASMEPGDNLRVFDGPFIPRLVFKYGSDLTMKQMENIAEETGYSFEHFISSYVEYRKAATHSQGSSNKTPSTELSTFSMNFPNESGLTELNSSTGTDHALLYGDASKPAGERKASGAKQTAISKRRGAEKLFHCAVEECNMSFVRQGDLNRHSKKHRPGEFLCTFPNCGKVFYRKDKLRLHWKKEHGDSSQPSDLGSGKSRRGSDRDGNSPSSGFPRNLGNGSLGGNTKKPSEGGSSDTSGSSSNDCNPNGRNWFFHSAERKELFITDNDMDIKRELNTDTQISANVLRLSRKPKVKLQTPAEESFQRSQNQGLKSENEGEPDSEEIVSQKNASSRRLIGLTCASDAQGASTTILFNDAESLHITVQRCSGTAKIVDGCIASSNQIVPVTSKDRSSQVIQYSYVESNPNSPPRERLEISSAVMERAGYDLYPIPNLFYIKPTVSESDPMFVLNRPEHEFFNDDFWESFKSERLGHARKSPRVIRKPFLRDRGQYKIYRRSKHAQASSSTEDKSENASACVRYKKPISISDVMLEERLKTMSIHNRDDVLPCLLREITGCAVAFPQSQRPDWHSHSLSHFGNIKPPKFITCIFCDAVFGSEDVFACWLERLDHIADHLISGALLETSQPDYTLVSYMFDNGLLSKEQYTKGIQERESSYFHVGSVMSYNSKSNTKASELQGKLLISMSSPRKTATNCGVVPPSIFEDEALFVDQ